MVPSVAHGLRPVAHVDLQIQVRDVALHGPLTQHQLFRDLTGASIVGAIIRQAWTRAQRPSALANDQAARHIDVRIAEEKVRAGPRRP